MKGKWIHCKVFTFGFIQNVPDFDPRRSPRIIDQQQRDTLSGFHLRRSPRLIEQQQRDAHLERRCVHYTVLRDSMTEVEKEAVLEKRRNAYRIQKTRNECGNTAEISEQLSITSSGSTTRPWSRNQYNE
ncbi:hypothetical protein C5167_023792 [Papaver somniferum]|uniref:Uncharacterized protein n=1 Tax=Papaver somniferum TaxID=3469 RepID=A0A4Y7JQC9_PAPSO|nr:hypothetical protein C5167_023792 [Papaver somniferum]